MARDSLHNMPMISAVSISASRFH